jgi:hypothetical protein
MRRLTIFPSSSSSLSFTRKLITFDSFGTAVVSSKKHYHYRNLDKDTDPFGEKVGWDERPALGGWQNIDVEAFVEAMESPEVQKKHFGPAWSRVKTLAHEAARRHGSFVTDDVSANNNVDDYKSEASRSLAFEKARREQLEQERREAEEEMKRLQKEEDEAVEEERKRKGTADDGSKIAEAEDDDDDSKPLSQKLSSRELRAAKIIMYDDSKMPSRNVEQEDYVSAPVPKMEELAGYQPPQALEIPKSIRADQDEEDDDDDDDDHEDEKDEDDSPQKKFQVERDSLGFPKSDPLHWDTEDIISWTEKFGPLETDYDLLEAFRMSKVDGHFMLEKINPPDLFKLMRKWHLAGRKRLPTKEMPENERVPLITLTTIQEQAILSFPYGPP